MLIGGSLPKNGHYGYFLELNRLPHVTEYMWMEHFIGLCSQNNKLTEFHFVFSYLNEGGLFILPDCDNSITQRRKMVIKEALTNRNQLCVFMQATPKFIFNTTDSRKKIHLHLQDSSYTIDLHMLEGPLLYSMFALLPVLSHTPMLITGTYNISCDIP